MGSDQYFLNEEVDKFSQKADQWWDASGPFKVLHQINPVRMTFLKETICRYFLREMDSFSALKGLSILDIGCGGGLVSEPLARLGAEVLGIDPSAQNIQVAQAHLEGENLSASYQVATVEKMEGKTFDVVIALEVLEHLEDAQDFLRHCQKLLAPKGVLILSTLTRTARSFLQGIVCAEYVLEWVPKGTHDWTLFMKPSELSSFAEKAGLCLKSLRGLNFNALQKKWLLTNDIKCNYFAVIEKVDGQ